MAALGVSHKIKIVRLRRPQRGTQRGFARISNGPGWQPSMLVSVVKRIETKVLARQRPVVFSEALHSIDDGRVALEAHALAQAIFENSRNQRPLRRFRGFSLDQGRQRHDSEHSAVVAATRLLTGCRRCKALPLFSE